ncbi:unnamed protein product, partial [Schistosoma turkestanicum]
LDHYYYSQIVSLNQNPPNVNADFNKITEVDPVLTSIFQIEFFGEHYKWLNIFDM